MKTIKMLLFSILVGISSLVVASSSILQVPAARLQIRIYHNIPCKLIPDPNFKSAEVFFEDKNYIACWAPLDEDHLFLFDETGDQGAVPVKNFRREHKV